MRFLTNKHMVLAMLIAPVLAVIAYFAVDHVVSEPPQPAQKGLSYKLMANPNCRYQSGACTLKNGDVEIHLLAERLEGNQVQLTLNSNLTVDKAIISIAAGDTTSPATEIGPDEDWRMRVEISQPEQSTVRVALNIAGSTYYAEVPAIFIDYKTAFSRENFSS